ncbi:MAG TPA: M13 family metallopeptidase [Burkholderiaceae bacterium]
MTKQSSLRPLVLAAAVATAFGAAAQGTTTTTTTETTRVTTTTQRPDGSLATSTRQAAAAATTTTAPPPGVLGSGIDRSGFDAAVRPQDDLFRATNGAWMAHTEIPADKSAWGTFYTLRDRSDADVRTLAEAAMRSSATAGSDERKIGDFYAAFLDTAAIDKAGLAPVEPSLADVDSVRDARRLVELMGHWQGVVPMPIYVDTDPGEDDPAIYAASFKQSGLGLPDRDYYLKDDPGHAAARRAYLAYATKLLALSGDRQAAAHARAVVALEARIAQAQWPRDQIRDPKRTHNPTAQDALATLAPGADWPAFLAAAQVPARAKAVDVKEPSYVTALAGLLRSQPLPTWKLYMKVRRLDAAAPVLPHAFRDAHYQYHGVAITGLKQEPARWQQAVDALNAALGQAVGRIYVGEHFPPASKARMLELVHNLLRTYASLIDGLTWMSPETKAAAHAKLDKYGVKIGYPDKWIDYAALDIRPGHALADVDRGAEFEYRRHIVRVGGPIDPTDWEMTPQTVNAYYSPNRNEIVFPAAILQPPFFDMHADDAANYGAIGAIIGHEISHGFDDQGSQYDGDGRLRNWWTDADRAAFKAITSRLVAQYAAYEPLPGQHVNGQLTLGENIADLSGLQIAYKAWKLSLHGQPSPVIDGIDGEQRFFYGFAQAWRTKVRDERQLQLLSIDPHSPGQFRADGAAINADGFHEAFRTKPGDGMWKAPADRIRLW